MLPLSERYQNLSLIGAGVSAKVYKAVDTHTGSVVAIKILNPHLQTDDVSLERFRREIQITRFLGHPQIVSIYELVTNSDRIYLVMEYIEGRNLKDFIKLHEPVEIDTALSILTQTLKILALCHSKNVIHRDLKPQNIMMTANGMVKLLDFGISRMTTLSDLTQTGTSLGSPEYMAPELFAANTYDPRTDIYALGVIAFELLTGELPFKGDSLPVLFHQHRTAPVPPLRQYRHDVPEWLQHLTDRLLAKQGYERYQSVDEVLADIGHRQVIAKQIPSLEKRECVNCGAATIAELPLCTFCGYDASCLKRGSYDIFCFEKEERLALQHYFQSVFDVRLPETRKTATLLISGIDRFSAEVLRKSALEHGIVLTVKRRSAFTLLKQVAVLAACVLLGLNTVVFGFNVLRLYILLPQPQQGFHFLVMQGVLLMLLCGVFVRVARRQVMRPVLRSKALTRRVVSEFSWLKELIRARRADESDLLQRFLSQMIEKYLLLLKAGTQLDAEFKRPLQEVLRGAARVADGVSRIDQALGAVPLLQQASDYAALQRQMDCEEDVGRKQLLRQRHTSLARQLERCAALEDQHAALMNKLIHLQYVFNTLLGKALVFRSPFEAYDLGLLDTCLSSLCQDVTVAREVEAELSRVA